MEESILLSPLDPTMLPAQKVLAFSLQHFSVLTNLRRLNSGPSKRKYSLAIANLCFMLPIRYRASQRSLQNSEKAALPFTTHTSTLPPNTYSYADFSTSGHPFLMHNHCIWVLPISCLPYILPPFDSILFFFFCDIRMSHGFRWCQSDLLS